MLMSKPAPVAALCVALLAACANGGAAQQDSRNADIANIGEVTDGFGPQFAVDEVDPSGIDPRLFQSQPVPAGVTFEPPDCARSGSDQLVPPGLEGNMAAVTAEGDGNRFITIAVETSEEIPLNVPDDACSKVDFTGANVRGSVERVEAPQIDGAQTVGSHRVLETDVAGESRTGELYTYVAAFGNFLVIVTANPLLVPEEPVAPVDTGRARQLLTESVSAVRG